MNLIRYAFKNIFRNLFLSISSILIIGLLVFFVNILLFVIYSTDRFIQSINDRIAININFQEGYDSTQLRSQQFLSGLQGFSGTVSTYISREDAFALLKARNPDLAGLVEQNDENPLPNSVRISNIPINDYTRLNTYISTFQDILQYDQGSFDKKLLDYRSQYDRIASIVDMLKMLQIAVWILLALFVFTVSIVVYMVIHNFIFFVRDEIRIIELVGGNPSFIYGPFVLQGMFYTLVASLIAVGATYGVAMVFQGQPAFAEFRDMIAGFMSLFVARMPMIVGGFSLIGAISAFFASWKYMGSTIGE